MARRKESLSILLILFQELKMHPFSLTQEQVEQVSGGARAIFDASMLDSESGYTPTTKIGEDGGELTTMAIGEEGGLPPGDLA
jgi:hypothetical protein